MPNVSINRSAQEAKVVLELLESTDPDQLANDELSDRARSAFRKIKASLSDPNLELAHRREAERAALEREHREKRIAPIAAVIAPAFVSLLGAVDHQALERSGELALFLARYILDHAGDPHG